MAANATVYKVSLDIADMDRHYYDGHNLTLAKHPSENDVRLMTRLVAFVLNADEDLVFCKGISHKFGNHKSRRKFSFWHSSPLMVSGNSSTNPN